MSAEMAGGIVPFGMSVDSSDASKAKEDLNNHAKSGPAVEQAPDKLGQSAEKAWSAIVRILAQAAKMTLGRRGPKSRLRSCQ